MRCLILRPAARGAASTAVPRSVALTVLLGLLLGLPLPSAPARAEEPDPVGVWPLDPRPEVVATFDPPDDPWGAGHRGVDLAGRIGQPVRSAPAR